MGSGRYAIPLFLSHSPEAVSLRSPVGLHEHVASCFLSFLGCIRLGNNSCSNFEVMNQLFINHKMLQKMKKKLR